MHSPPDQPAHTSPHWAGSVTWSSRVTEGEPMSKKERGAGGKDLEAALSSIEKEFGKGSIMYLGDMGGQDVACLSTGSLSLDLALGGKGIPRGRIVEVYG